MKFDFVQTRDERGDIYYKGDVAIQFFIDGKPCQICKEPTSWVSLSFETSICSQECLTKLWDEFSEYNERARYSAMSNQELNPDLPFEELF